MGLMALTGDSFVLNAIFFVLGMIVLIKGSGWFIDASSFIARRYGIPEIVIGLTLVSLGTSLPEFATVVYSSAAGESGIAFGDIIGANITNITLVLGIGTTLIGTLPVSKIMLKRDGLIMTGIFALLLILCCIPGGTSNACLGRFDGALLVLIFILYILLLLTRKKDSICHEDENAEHLRFKGISHASLFFIIGLVMVFFGAKLMVDNIVWIAESFNMPKELIAATIVALGTTVPELAVTITGVIKKQSAIALGNIIGSCIINIVLILGTAALIRPIFVSREMLFSIVLMLIAGIFLMFAMFTGTKLSRWEGICFLGLYALFFGYNVYKIL